SPEAIDPPALPDDQAIPYLRPLPETRDTPGGVVLLVRVPEHLVGLGEERCRHRGERHDKRGEPNEPPGITSEVHVAHASIIRQFGPFTGRTAALTPLEP